MKIQILEEGGPQPFNEEGFDYLIRQILLDDFDEIVYDNSREHEFQMISGNETLKNALKNSKTKLVLIKNGDSIEPDEEFFEGGLKIINSPFHLIRDTILELQHKIGDIKNYKVSNFKVPILYLNGKPHMHRCVLMNNFQKNEMGKRKYKVFVGVDTKRI